MNEKLGIVFERKAEKDLKRLKKADKVLFEKIRDAIDSIRINPYIGEPKQGDLKGFSCLDVYHQSTNYEIAYRLEISNEGDIVVVIMIGPRENFYRDLKHYLGIL